MQTTTTEPTAPPERTEDRRTLFAWAIGRSTYLTENEANAAAETCRQLRSAETEPRRLTLVETRDEDEFDVWIVERDGERLHMSLTERGAKAYAGVTNRLQGPVHVRRCRAIVVHLGEPTGE